MRLILLLVSLFASLSTGCITVAGDNLGDVSPSPPATAPSIEQTVGDFSFHLDGGKMVTSNKMGRELNDAVLDIWVKKGFISGHTYVRSSQFTNTAQHRLTLSGHQEGESSVVMQVLSGLTLFLIPYSVDSQMSLVYTLENAETGCSYEVSVADSYDTIISLMLLPVSPFAQGGRMRTFDRIASNAYAELVQRGGFGPDGECATGESSASAGPQP